MDHSLQSVEIPATNQLWMDDQSFPEKGHKGPAAADFKSITQFYFIIFWDQVVHYKT